MFEFAKLGVANFDFSLTILKRTKGFLNFSSLFSRILFLADCFLAKVRLFWHKKADKMEYCSDYFDNFVTSFYLFSLSLFPIVLSKVTKLFDIIFSLDTFLLCAPRVGNFFSSSILRHPKLTFRTKVSLGTIYITYKKAVVTS